MTKKQLPVEPVVHRYLIQRALVKLFILYTILYPPIVGILIFMILFVVHEKSDIEIT